MKTKLTVIGERDPATSRVLELLSRHGELRVLHISSPGEGRKASLLTPHVIVVHGKTFLQQPQTFREIREAHAIPIVVYTDDAQDEALCLEMGASDVIILPLQEKSLLPRLKNHLRIRRLLEEMEKVDNVLFTIARIVEAKDYYTKGHIQRVTNYSFSIGLTMGLTEKELKTLKIGALLHDIGKIAIPDAILTKKGPLTPEEMEVIKRHPLLGYKICKPLTAMKEALEIILYHHERWDGTGYPKGLKGEEIPFLARIVAVADVFDAISSTRVYSTKRLSDEESLRTLEKAGGKELDPQIVEAFTKGLKNLSRH